jgi:hypothetical protein
MANSVKPIVPPNPIVSPLKDYESFQLDDRELFLIDGYANEHVGIIGTRIEYWALDVAGSKKDPLYGEATDRDFKGPFKYTVWFSYTPSTPEVREEGFVERYQPTAWLPRKMVEEANAGVPLEGDVIRAWNIPFYALYGVADHEAPPDAGYYFNVIDVDTDGQVFDNASFVGYKLQLNRRTEFTPERRVKRP